MHRYKVSKIAKTCPLKLKDNKNFPRAFSLSITSVTDPNFIAIKLSTWIIECLYWNPHLVHCYHQLIRCIWWGTARSGRTRRRLRPIAGHKPPPTISQQNTSWSLETLSQSFKERYFFVFVFTRDRAFVNVADERDACVRIGAPSRTGVDRGPSRPVRPSPSAGALKFYLGTEIKWKDIELFKTCILKRIEFYGLLNRWRHRQWTWNLSIALHQDINFSFRWIEYYNHCSIIFCGYKSKQKVDVKIVWGW